MRVKMDDLKWCRVADTIVADKGVDVGKLVAEKSSKEKGNLWNDTLDDGEDTPKQKEKKDKAIEHVGKNCIIS